MSWKKDAVFVLAAGVALCLITAMGAEPGRELVIPNVQVEQPTPDPGPVMDPVPEPMVDVPPAEVLPAYDYTVPAPETAAVEKEYFEDAAFIGDSRTDGFMVYSGIGRGENLTSNGLSIFKLGSKKALKIAGEEYTLLEALERKQYGKVYLSLGVNELGIYNDEGFYQAYLSAIDAIRAAQPNAVIYIQGLIPLNEEEIMATSGKDYLKNDHLRVYNELMFKAAREKQVVFLDLYSAFADENGQLPPGASRDGVHLKKDYCQQWLAYLQTHTVDPSILIWPEAQTESEENLSA